MSNLTFQQAHPNCVEYPFDWSTHRQTEAIFPKMYQRLDEDGKILEQWEVDEDGELQNVTDRVLLEQEIALAKQELMELQIKNAKTKPSGRTCFVVQVKRDGKWLDYQQVDDPVINRSVYIEVGFEDVRVVEVMTD